MNENVNILDTPEIAEAKEPHRPSHQVLALKREIMTYAGSLAHYLDRINELENIVVEQKTQIDELTTAIEGTRQIVDYSYKGGGVNQACFEGGYKNEINALENQIYRLENQIENLESELNKISRSYH